MSEVSVNEVEQGWEGTKAMGEQLVAEALGGSVVTVAPMDDRVMIFPVVADETRPVDLTIVQLGNQDLPDIGVVISVGWKVNAEVIDQLRKLEGKKNPSALDAAMKQGLIDNEFVGQGDIVCVNKFSGMDVPGTNFIVLSRQDVLCKLHDFPVRLREEQDRWDQVEEKRLAHEGEVAAQSIQRAPSTIISASK